MAWANKENPKVVALFDVDGTLTPSRKSISKEMQDLLANLRKKCIIGFVGGSDLAKQLEQLGEDVLDRFDFAFSENGLTAYKLGKPLASQSFIQWIGEEKYQKLVNFILHYIADLKIPVKRGTFVEFRRGMLNVSPIGRNCSYEERLEFEKYDALHHVRETMVHTLKEKFPDLSLMYAIGGQISFDAFPKGWDKTYCLRHLEQENVDQIHFFGDKTQKGGNDYEIFSHEKVTGHTVTSPEQTQQLIKSIFCL